MSGRRSEYKTLTSQLSSTPMVMKTLKRRFGCKQVRRICIVCKANSIHGNDAQYDSRVCFRCATEGLQPSGSLVAPRSSTAAPCMGSGRKDLNVSGRKIGSAGEGGFTPEVVEIFARAEANVVSAELARLVGSLKTQLFAYGTLTGKQWTLLKTLAETPSPAAPVSRSPVLLRKARK